MFAFTDEDHWVLGIGDPTVAGWLTVAAYFMTALLCWRCSNIYKAGGKQDWGLRCFWAVFAAAMTFLGLNKQLDLQTWLTFFGRSLALNEGWYNSRQTVQAAFIGVVAMGGMASLYALRRLAGKASRPVVLALVGGLFLGCFIVIRASSFHHVDRLLGLNFQGLKINWILELGSISWIASATLAELRAHKRDQASARGV